MTKLMAGIFLGVFFGALGYELVSRHRPEVIESIRQKVAEKVDEMMGVDDYDDLESEEAVDAAL